MYFDLTDEQQAIKSTAQDFLAARYKSDRIRELADVVGPEATPRLLARVAELSGGRSVQLNVDLVINNARIAGRVARSLTERG